jgi:hypothetical protein
MLWVRLQPDRQDASSGRHHPRLVLTRNRRVTGRAGRVLAFPPCSATIKHAPPTLVSVTTFPLTQANDVMLERHRQADAVALTLNADRP